jgi:transposase
MATRGKEVDFALRELAVKLHGEGKSLRKIAKTIGKPHSTVQSIIEKYKIRFTVKNLPGRGRKKILTAEDHRYIVRQIKKNPKTSVPKLTENVSNTIQRPISTNTVRRVLRSEGYHGRIARKKPYISLKNKKKRLEFAKCYIDKPKSFWNEVIFSDESKKNIFGSDGRQIVWRQKNTELKPNNVQSTVKFGGGNVKFWGCFSASGVGNLVFIDGIMDQYVYLNILKKNLHDSAAKLGLLANYRFQQDNDPKHMARTVQTWMQKNVPNQLKTPPQSPDLNPIEHLWKILKDKVEQNHQVTNQNQLKAAILAEWANINAETTQKLVDSMENRLHAVIAAGGAHTKY